jgi:hypothetical protein
VIARPVGPFVFRAVGLGLGVLLGLAWFVLEPGAWGFDRLLFLDVLVFVAAAAVTELLPIRQPGVRGVPASLAIIGAAAILGAPPVTIAGVAAGGWLLSQIVREGAAEPGPWFARLVGAWALGGLAAIGSALLPARWVGEMVGDGGAVVQLDIGPALAVGLALIVGLPAVEAAIEADGRWQYLPRRALEAIRANFLVGAAVASTAVLGALVYPALGPWTLPTMLIPLLAARVGLDRYDVASRAYDQTIRAMSRLPEQFGSVQGEHGVRVGQLAREVALELGLDAATIESVERAGYLHELGRIQFERDASLTQRDLALAGAGVIRGATDERGQGRRSRPSREDRALDRVADIVAAHGEVAATPLAAVKDRTTVDLPARIVAACCEVDRYAPDLRDHGQRQEVTVRLVRDVGDLDVVAALTRVLTRADLPTAPARS